MEDLNSLSFVLADQTIVAGLEKATPPGVYNRIRSWLRRLKSHRMPPSQLAQVREQLAVKFQEAMGLPVLAKNQVAVSVYDGGSMKMEFGSDVPKHVKEAAMKWAKRRGLDPVEASMAKSESRPEWVLFGSTELSVPVTRKVYSVKN